VPSFYIRRNIAVTTSGMCSENALRCMLEAMGDENVMFSIDYPFEKTDAAAQFIESAKITEASACRWLQGTPGAYCALSGACRWLPEGLYRRLPSRL